MKPIVGLGVVGALLLAPLVSAQGMAAAAEREKARRAALTGSTPASAVTTPASPSASAPARATQAEAAPAAPADTARGATSEEARWRERASQARAAVAAADAKLRELEARAEIEGPTSPGPHDALCEESIVGFQAGSALRPDHSRRSLACDFTGFHQARVRSVYSEIPPARESLERARLALASLDQEARKAGASPDWIR